MLKFHFHRLQFKLISKLCRITDNLENARTHVAKEVEAADHNQHIMAKLLEQSKYVILQVSAPLLSFTSSFGVNMCDRTELQHSMGLFL